MEIILTEAAKKDLAAWKKSGNTKVLKRIRELLVSIMETPFEGIGKPEPLKYQMTGLWSRRITQEDRMVYEINDDAIYIFSLKGHYKKS